MNTEPWVTADHVAQHLGVAKDPVYRWRKNLPAHRVGRLWTFQLSEPAADTLHQEDNGLWIPLRIDSGEQDKLIADFVRADEMEWEAARLRQSAWVAFDSALFTPTKPSAA